MTYYRKKSVAIRAIQWTGDNFAEVAVLGDSIFGLYDQRDSHLEIKTLEGWMIANFGDWIIQGVKGEVYLCKDDIFVATYEAI